MLRLLVWGTGGGAREAMEDFKSEDHEVIGFVDNSPARPEEFYDKPVHGPEALASLKAGTDYDLLIIASVYREEISAQALRLGVPPERILTSSYMLLLPHAAHMTPEQWDTLSAVPVWYHSFEILPGVPTPGVCEYKPWLLAHPEVADLTGRKALDIGAWDGPYTLEMTRRGAQVTAFDIQPSSHSGFDAMRRVNNLAARHICSNVYALNPQEHGTFDLVTFFGVYYHLKNPLAALANINAVLRPGGLVLVEGAVLEGAPRVDEFWAGRADLLESMADIPLGYYVKGEYEGEWSNWWVPNMACLRHWIESCGFEVLHADRVEKGERAYFVARKVDEIPLEHKVLPPAGMGFCRG